MPIQNYGVLCGSIKDKLDSASALKKVPGGSPHYEILLQAANINYRIAVNVKSNDSPPDLLFYLDDNYKGKNIPFLTKLPDGYTALSSNSKSGAIDFLRGHLFDLKKMRVVPAIQDPVSGNDLNDIFTLYLDQAMKTPGSRLFAFGSRWGPEEQLRDQYFDFLPGNGIHDIHMNQGDHGQNSHANGIWQDGALFIDYPDENRWIAMFLRFQSQSTKTDKNGNPL